MKNTTSACGQRYKSGIIKCSDELMPGKGGGEGTKPAIREINQGTMQWLKEQEVETDNDVDK